MKFLIIGNGVAGTTAALNIRKFDTQSEIVVVSEEAYPFYSRIRLIDFLAGEAKEQDLIIFKDEWYEKNKITLILNTKVVSIETGTKEIILSSRRKLKFDRLLVAAGSVPFVPPIEDIGKKGVFTLRTLDDAKRIRDYSKDRDNIIILGGGLLGIEVGNALRKAGKLVSIVEYFPRLLPRQMDIEGSAILKKMLEDMGLKFYLNAKAKMIAGNNVFEGLILEDGSRINGEMAIISSGVKPDLSLLKDTGIKPGRGIPVNDRMETEAADIFAAGDIAEHRGITYGIWHAADKQGEVAGINMAGGNAAYEGTVPSNILKVAGIDLMSAGEIDADCSLPGSVIIKDAEKGIYKKIVVDDNCVVGCILCGDTSGRKEILEAIKERRTINELQNALGGLKPAWSR